MTVKSGQRLHWATLATALACGVSGGVFFAFSAFVMPGLDRLPHADAIAAMQAINRAAETPAFMTLLFGSALACAALGIHVVTRGESRRGALELAGTGLYLLVTIGLTVAYHVPLNDELAAVKAHGAGSAARWDTYLTDWTTANHFRAVAALAAATLLTVAAMQRVRG